MSLSFSYFLPVLLGLCMLLMVALVFVLQRHANRRDKISFGEGYADSSEENGNPYQPPSTLELDDHVLGAEPGYGNGGVRPLICVVAAVAVGALSRLCRPLANVGGVHYEALVALFILIGLALLLVYLNHPSRVKLPHLFFQLENFSLWLAFAFGWTVANRGLWDDFVLFNVVAMGCSAVIGSGLLAVLGRLRHNSSAI